MDLSKLKANVQVYACQFGLRPEDGHMALEVLPEGEPTLTLEEVSADELADGLAELIRGTTEPPQFECKDPNCPERHTAEGFVLDLQAVNMDIADHVMFMVCGYEQEEEANLMFSRPMTVDEMTSFLLLQSLQEAATDMGSLENAPPDVKKEVGELLEGLKAARKQNPDAN